MKQSIQIIIIALLTTGIFVPFSFGAQDKEVPDIALSYLKKSDGTVYLEAYLSVYTDDENPLPEQYIHFYTGIDSMIEIGTMFTDRSGKAGINIPATFNIPVNEEGYFKYRAVFEGNDSIEMAGMEVEFKDLILEMTLEEIDSVKTITLKATHLAETGEIIPVPEEDVYIFVTRMFSMLSIAEDWLDEEGEISIEFPDDLQGDSIGMVTIVAMFQDHSIYGNVENRQTIQWGIPTDHSIPESFRALWTQYAPNWMVITLSILLLGVWSHYFFVIFKLVLVKRKGKEEMIKNHHSV